MSSRAITLRVAIWSRVAEKVLTAGQRHPCNSTHVIRRAVRTRPRGRGGTMTEVIQESMTEAIALLDGQDGELTELTWQERALCAQTDPEAFFPEKGGSTREAKKVCSGCEVRAECLDYALENDERFGIWGGLSERERRKLKRRAV